MKYPSFSFEGQDRILHSIFRDLAGPGFYIDVGCNHPIIENNTYSLYCSGWSGICIDMNGAFKESYNKFRPRDHFLEAAVSIDQQPLTAFINSDTRLSTCSPEIAQHYSKHPLHSQNFLTQKTVTSSTLAQICNENLPDTWHLLAVDVEGYESQVLSTLHLCDVMPICIIVEIKNVSLLNGILQNPVASYLHKHGFLPIAKTPLDTFFINSSHMPRWMPPSLIHG
jgi:FkbM family methyltransferase